MGAHKWADIKARRMTAEEIAESRRQARAEILAMNLRELREMANKTQEELAEIAEVTQAQISRTETGEDHKISTLRRYVEALGGQLEVVAVLGNKRVTLPV